MTNKEAMRKIYDILHDDWFSWAPESVEAFNMALAAMRKEINNTTGSHQAVKGNAYRQPEGA